MTNTFSQPQRVLIMGAAGRDFHNFNVVFRNDPAFRWSPSRPRRSLTSRAGAIRPELAGELYPQGIPIVRRGRVGSPHRELAVDHLVVFAYSDVSHDDGHAPGLAVLAAGADFGHAGAKHTMLQSTKPVVAVTRGAHRQRQEPDHAAICAKLLRDGPAVVAVRHPMPYGDLAAQAVQRFASYADLDRHHCTIEEREEYEPHIDRGVIVYAGVDYERSCARPSRRPMSSSGTAATTTCPSTSRICTSCLVDPHGQATSGLPPGEANVRMANVVVINKIDTADLDGVTAVRDSIRQVNPNAVVVEAASPIFVDDPAAICGKDVLVVEDGPTLTHGEMAYGAGLVAARRFGAARIIDPRPWAVGSIAATFAKYSGTGPVLPAMGYGDQQQADLQETINDTPCDLVIVATPIDLSRVVEINRPTQRVHYELQEIGQPDLAGILREWLAG
jgi:predicted GTPase